MKARAVDVEDGQVTIFTDSDKGARSMLLHGWGSLERDTPADTPL